MLQTTKTAIIFFLRRFALTTTVTTSTLTLIPTIKKKGGTGKEDEIKWFLYELQNKMVFI